MAFDEKLAFEKFWYKTTTQTHSKVWVYDYPK